MPPSHLTPEKSGRQGERQSHGSSSFLIQPPLPAASIPCVVPPVSLPNLDTDLVVAVARQYL